MTRLAHDLVGEGPPLVCLHPVGLDRTSWDAFARVAARRYQLIRIDLLGHGQSPDRLEGTTVDDDCRAVADLLDVLGVTSAAIIGISFGGMIAQTLAVHRSDLVSSLVLCACPPGISPKNRPGLRDRGRPALEGGMAAILDSTMKRWFSNDFRCHPDAAAVRERLATDDPGNWALGWKTISTFDLRPRLAEITSPTLCIAGEEDVATPLSAMQALARSIRKARLQVIPAAPHMLHIEKAEELFLAVDAFLSGAGRKKTPPEEPSAR